VSKGKDEGRREKMDISLIIKIAGIGLLISVSTQMLKGAGRDEQSMMVTLAGILVVLGLLIGKIGELFDQIMTLFGL
jgi:stage III sporulation protein AC